MEFLSLLAGYGEAFLAFSLFGCFHSIGAQEWFKDRLCSWTHPFFVKHFWRLVYCVISYLLFYNLVSPLVWSRSLHPSLRLFTYPAFIRPVLPYVRLSGLLLCYTAFLQSDYLELSGIKQAWRGLLQMAGFGSSSREIKLFGKDRLVVSGIYRWIRHPMLAGGFLMTVVGASALSGFVFTLMFATYMWVGVYYEERRLVRNFGAQYLEYRTRVGAFFPRIGKVSSAE